MNPFKQSAASATLDRIGVSDTPANPFKKSSNPDLREDSVLGRAVPELERKAKNEQETDVFSMKSLARIGKQ